MRTHLVLGAHGYQQMTKRHETVKPERVSQESVQRTAARPADSLHEQDGDSQDHKQHCDRHDRNCRDPARAGGEMMPQDRKREGDRNKRREERDERSR
jgi:hypothetical protein